MSLPPRRRPRHRRGADVPISVRAWRKFRSDRTDDKARDEVSGGRELEKATVFASRSSASRHALFQIRVGPSSSRAHAPSCASPWFPLGVPALCISPVVFLYGGRRRRGACRPADELHARRSRPGEAEMPRRESKMRTFSSLERRRATCPDPFCRHGSGQQAQGQFDLNMTSGCGRR